MKLNKHERRIVSKINDGEVYDIPSYLREFGKGRAQTYDMDAIRRKFADDESGKKYKVMKEGKSLLTVSHSTMEILGHTVYNPTARSPVMKPSIWIRQRKSLSKPHGSGLVAIHIGPKQVK